ncbi:hypothetical protein IFR04_004863 [Cadophora malorum]|uniref:Uncharacterized protein n=1 Tax=Cadophora malorum TaxID=108018 RepID=A0A8H8BRU7_9HELO|nr:hypothetical protein IFR04_004863 [Cadophora malorum]
MSETAEMEKEFTTDDAYPVKDEAVTSETSSQAIYIDPEKEKAALKKFDEYTVPASFVFMLLCALDRSNLGNARVFGFDEDIGLHGRQFSNINTFSALTTMLFEVPWVLAVRGFGASKTLGVAFCKRIITNNLAMCLSGAFGGLFAWAIQQMGTTAGLAAWRWLFIVEFLITVVVGAICWIFLPSAAETALFLNAEEKDVMRLRKERDAIYRGAEKFDRRWMKIALLDPFVWLIGIEFFTSSVAINGFNAGYAAMFILVLGIFPTSTLVVSWVAGTLAPDDKRAFGMPFASSIGNLSNFVSSQLYPTQQAP